MSEEMKIIIKENLTEDDALNVFSSKDEVTKHIAWETKEGQVLVSNSGKGLKVYPSVKAYWEAIEQYEYLEFSPRFYDRLEELSIDTEAGNSTMDSNKFIGWISREPDSTDFPSLATQMTELLAESQSDHKGKLFIYSATSAESTQVGLVFTQEFATQEEVDTYFNEKLRTYNNES